MKTALAAFAALALLATVVPAVAAQEPTGMSMTAGNAGSVAYAGSGSIPFNVTVGCAELLSRPQATVVVSVSDPPAWFNFTATEVTPPLTGCTNPTTAQTTVGGSLPFTVAAGAPAVSLQRVNLTATLGTGSSALASSNSPGATFTVAYKSCYSLKPSVTFPLTVTNKTTTFTVVGTQCSNAPSMIMVDDFSASDGALVSGIGAHQYQNKAGTPQTYTYTVTFTVPDDDHWVSANTTLKTFGHYNFDGMAGDPMDRLTTTWQFVNGMEHSGGGGKSSPAPVGAFTALGLLGLAAILRRKD